MQRRHVSLESHLAQPGMVAVHKVHVPAAEADVSKYEPYAQTLGTEVSLAAFTVQVFGVTATSLVYPVQQALQVVAETHDEHPAKQGLHALGVTEVSIHDPGGQALGAGQAAENATEIKTVTNIITFIVKI